MNDYTGKICPFCKTELTSKDDIVVCSECDMPHHKDCWVENQGCTTFGCLGTIKAADNKVSSVTTTQMNYDNFGSTARHVSSGVVFCTHCGAQNANTSSFCSRCGDRLTAVLERTPQSPVYTQASPNNSNPYSYANQPGTPYQQQNSYQIDGYNTYQSYQTPGINADLQQLVGKKTEYYATKFQMMKSHGKSYSWNWAAFLVTPYWMMYRKMYGYGAVVLAADIIISLIGSGFLSLLILGAYIAFGFLGNGIYMKYLEGKANQAKSMNEPYRSQFISANCGVNTTAAVLTLIGRALLVGVLLA